MIFRQLFDFDTFTYTYLIASGIAREAIIIDPVKSNTAVYHKLINIETSYHLISTFMLNYNNPVQNY